MQAFFDSYMAVEKCTTSQAPGSRLPASGFDLRLGASASSSLPEDRQFVGAAHGLRKMLLLRWRCGRSRRKSWSPATRRPTRCTRNTPPPTRCSKSSMTALSRSAAKAPSGCRSRSYPTTASSSACGRAREGQSLDWHNETRWTDHHSVPDWTAQIPARPRAPARP